jgi:class 3 adenylate cyclase
LPSSTWKTYLPQATRALGLRRLLHGIILHKSEFDAVLCPTCDSANREGRKFCAACGAALTIRCPNCGFANEATERFCGGCGRPLAQGTSEDDKPKPSAELEGDRRPVTVLFCDLVGYTRLSSVMDPEDVHALLERFFALIDAKIDRFGGTIDKHIGDAAMALFGAPLARGNDAERAVRAALDIQSSVPVLASSLPSPLAVHIGIATGEVIASSVGSDHHRGYTVTGEAANVAARLLDRAAASETLVSDAVYQVTNHVARRTSRRGLATDRTAKLASRGACVGRPPHGSRPVSRRAGGLHEWFDRHRRRDPR